ncbi:flavin reductase family protein [Cereibacter sphaeroides]|uniref:flavin reductase family protein n=1 Tax=Cereibacter sphaeroides TaxID=1063 RepID=UPI001F46EB85|nr:flavin reductase family protein [Cereibacter sphaeroides]MCE6951866.1 flavin reductase family protein [Cereibacter sphaeroides]MCE6961178.1 flavin reductase family protein [Cereibacter sphaeroides]MCE6974097.1 flavin reductase family protein [Cereibacter sphaeroides]
MFYRPEDGHGLPHNPFNAIVTPRPIGWISTRGPDGDNLAPYSFFNAVAYVPPQVMFASTGAKDSLAALRASGVFCVNIVEEAALAAMNATSAAFPRGVDEFEAAGVPKAECRTIPCPRVEGAPASLECRVTQVVELLGRDNHLILGEVTGVHLRDDCLVAGRFDVTRFRPMARLGYRDYAVVREVMELARPGEG